MITRGRSTLACLGAGVALVASAGVAPAALGDPTPPAADTQGEVCNKPATLSVAGESGDPTVGQPVTVSGICFPVGEQTRGTVNVAGAESQSEGITSDRNGRVSYTFVPEEPGEHIVQIVLQGERNNADISFDVAEAEPAPDDPEPSDGGGDDSKDDNDGRQRRGHRGRRHQTRTTTPPHDLDARLHPDLDHIRLLLSSIYYRRRLPRFRLERFGIR